MTALDMLLARLCALLAEARRGARRLCLTCFRTDGGDLSKVEVPFHMATSGTLTVSVSEIKLDSSQTETRCPA